MEIRTYVEKTTTPVISFKSTAALGVGFWAAGGVSAKASNSALEEVRFGCIGVGGKGSSDSGDANKFGKVVAICDIDDKIMGKAIDRFDSPRTYNDYRELIEKEEKKLTQSPSVLLITITPWQPPWVYEPASTALPKSL